MTITFLNVKINKKEVEKMKLYCRIYQFLMKVGMNFIKWKKPVMISGADAVSEIPDILKEKNVSSVLIVTDKGIVSFKLHERLLKVLKENKIDYVIYDKTVPNPTIDNIEEGLGLYKENGCGAIITIGGGSPMDCAKGIGARASNPNKTISKMRGLLKVKKRPPLLIAIPTTAGTGSETTVAAVITDGETHEKYAINDPKLVPDYAVLDPNLTVSLPASLTATTGMDALTHAVEAYIGNSNTKETKQNAVMAVKLIFRNLTKAVKDGKDLEARENMQKAAFMAGVAFTRAYVGNVHSIAHTLGGEYSVPHGLANAIILPKVLEFYGKSIYKKIYKLCEEAEILTIHKNPKERCEAFIAKIYEMNKLYDIPTQVEKLKKEDINKLAKRAYAESNPLYPVPKIMSVQDFEKIYDELLANKY